MMSGKFEIRTAGSGKHFFYLKAGNGQIILQSEMYETQSALHNGIESVRKNSPDDDRYKRISDDKGHRFHLRAGNQQVIGSSEYYTSPAGRDNGIESVKKWAPYAEVE